MSYFDIITDSACDMDEKKMKELDITIIPFWVSYNGKDYYKDGIEITADNFIHTIIKEPEIVPKTSTPAPELYESAFESIINSGKDVLCICATQTLTSIIRTACAARDSVLEKYPDANIAVIDSEQLTASLGDFVEQACNMRDANCTLSDALKKLDKIKETSRTYFFIQSTKYLHLGGRIGKVGAVASSILNIKPLIVLKSGEISPFGISRSRKSALNKIVAAAKEYFSKENIEAQNISVCIGASDDVSSEVPLLRKLLETELKVIVKPYEYMIGAAVTAHTGPGIIGFSLLSKAETV